MLRAPRRIRNVALIAATSAALYVPAFATGQQGPERGALVIVGGAMRDPQILDRFIQLAGGHDAPIVVIPTAGGAPHYDPSWEGMAAFRQAGASRLTLLHTYDPDVADRDGFAEPIRQAGGVWFTGGRQWRIADAYLGTRVEVELRALLDRGGVIGGSSAGATIQGEYLARGDSSTNTIMMGDHEEGFAFVTGVAIDQHLLQRNRQFDLLEIITARPDLLGIGIDEDTAIVVHGNRFEVIGRSYVAIYDSQRRIDSGGDFYLLAPGDRYDLSAREAFRPQTTLQPLERVIRREAAQE
ncbi:MAG TPA: cyanophycinase [Acidobacteriota bacterium]|nr:cyanophycinase [Acidobacteriota bacterium]